MDHSIITPLYESLDRAKREFRLLHIQPSLHMQDDIQLTMRIASLDDQPVYTAVSYCWGDPNITEDIWVDKHKLAVTTNLADGLRQFRVMDPPTSPVWIWVDAVCIDQQDSSEKGHQVAEMRHIYRDADEVRVWLGKADEQCEKGLTLLGIIDAFATEDDAEAYFQGRKDDREIDLDVASLVRLSALPYWERLW